MENESAEGNFVCVINPLKSTDQRRRKAGEAFWMTAGRVFGDVVELEP